MTRPNFSVLGENIVLVLDESIRPVSPKVSRFPVLSVIQMFSEYLSGTRRGEMYANGAFGIADRLLEEYECTVDEVINAMDILDPVKFGTLVSIMSETQDDLTDDERQSVYLYSLALSTMSDNDPDLFKSLDDLYSMHKCMAKQFGWVGSERYPGNESGGKSNWLIKTYRHNENFADDARICLAANVCTFGAPLSSAESSLLAAELTGYDQLLNTYRSQFIGRIEIGIQGCEWHDGVPVAIGEFVEDEESKMPLSFVVHVFSRK